MEASMHIIQLRNRSGGGPRRDKTYLSIGNSLWRYKFPSDKIYGQLYKVDVEYSDGKPTWTFNWRVIYKDYSRGVSVVFPDGDYARVNRYLWSILGAYRIVARKSNTSHQLACAIGHERTLFSGKIAVVVNIDKDGVVAPSAKIRPCKALNKLEGRAAGIVYGKTRDRGVSRHVATRFIPDAVPQKLCNNRRSDKPVWTSGDKVISKITATKNFSQAKTGDIVGAFRVIKK